MILMKNKKGWIRILEAFIGIVIVITGVLFLISNNPIKKDISKEVYEKQAQILEVIANDESMRKDVMNGETDSINEYIRKNLPETLDFTTNICEVDMICNTNTPNDRDLYISETIISATLTSYPGETSRKLMFFIWRK